MELLLCIWVNMFPIREPEQTFRPTELNAAGTGHVSFPRATISEATPAFTP